MDLGKVKKVNCSKGLVEYICSAIDYKLESLVYSFQASFSGQPSSAAAEQVAIFTFIELLHSMTILFI